jgi:hypothetical protein
MMLGALAPGGPLGIDFVGGAHCPSPKQLQGIVDLSDPCQTGGGGVYVTLDPTTGLSPLTTGTLGPTGILTPAIDWSNPNATVSAGDTLPNGDTYAGPITTAGQIQADLNLGNPVPASGGVGITPYLLLGGVVLALMMIGGRR